MKLVWRKLVHTDQFSKSVDDSIAYRFPGSACMRMEFPLEGKDKPSLSTGGIIWGECARPFRLGFPPRLIGQEVFAKPHVARNACSMPRSEPA
jgi:hypothetical protein